MGKTSKLDFSNYMKSVLKTSLLTGIPQIAEAKNRWRKIVRTLVLFVCIAGFIYQSLSFMNLYWEYKTVVDVKVTNPTFITKPAVTLCHKNGLMLRKLCNASLQDVDIEKEYGLQCKKFQKGVDDHLCKCTYERYCKVTGELGDNFYDLPPSNVTSIISLPWEVKEQWMIDDPIIRCMNFKMDGHDSLWEDCEAPRTRVDYGCPNENEYPEYCMSLFSHAEHPELEREMVISDAGIRILTHLYDKEAPYAYNHPQVYIGIHNPFRLMNPFYDGFKMERNVAYYFHMKKTEWNMLPAPYETNCVDYMALWKARGGWGPLNKLECVQECRKNLSLARHGCVAFTIQFPGRELRCPRGFIDDKLIPDSEECVNKECKAPCFEEIYIIDREVAVRELSSPCEYPDEEAMTVFYVMYDGMETTIYTYNPQYHPIETFSYLGGYVGMWLGISLVAVFDFIEAIVAMIRYPIRKYLHSRAKRSRVKRMKTTHRFL